MARLGELFDTAQEAVDVLRALRDDVQNVKSGLDDLRETAVETNARLGDVVDEIQITNNRVSLLHSLLQDGLVNLSTGISDLIKLGVFTNDLLRHQIQQNDTTNCILEKISQGVCHLQNESSRQSRLQDEIVDCLSTIKDVAVTTNAEAYLDLKRRKELKEQIEECCPPEPERLPCIYEPCPSPGGFNRPAPQIDHEPLSRPPVPG